MGDESVSAVRLGITFTMLAAVLVFVVFNIIWGQDMNRDFNARMDNTESQATSKYFKQTSSEEGADMPVSAAYSLYENNINDVDAVAIGRFSSKTTKITATGWFTATNDGNWKFETVDREIDKTAARITGDTGAVQDSVTYFRKYKWDMVSENGITYDGTSLVQSEAWLKNNMYGKCNVRTASTKNGTYVMLVSVYS